MDKDEIARLANYKDTVMTYKAKNGELVSYNDAMEAELDNVLDVNEELEGDLKNLRLKVKDLRSFTKVVTNTVLDSIKVPFEVKLPCDSFSTTFEKQDTHYWLKGSLTESLLSIDTLSIPNEQKIYVSSKRNGFLKPKSFVVTLQNTNPYVQTIGLQNYTIENRKKWYEKDVWKFGAGFLGGYLLFRQ